MLRDLYMPRKTKAALASVSVPIAGKSWRSSDTWERACPDKGCGYTFNYYHWPWITAELPLEEGGSN